MSDSNNSFAFSEVVRKLANLVRIGKVVEKQKDTVKVKIGEVVTNFLPIVSTSGNTTIFVPITIGEQVIVVSPYGEMTQAFVLRSIHYNECKPPDDLEVVTLKTDTDIKANAKNGDIIFDENCVLNGANAAVQILEDFILKSSNTTFQSRKGLVLKCGGATISVSNDGIAINSGGASINLNSSGIQLSYGSSTIDLSGGNIAISSGSITTSPPICKCSGGF